MNSNRKTSIKASNLQLRSDHTVVSLNASLMSSETKLGNQTESSTRGEKYKESREDKHDMKRYKDDITSRSRGETIFWDRDVFEFPLLEATAAKMKAIQEKRKIHSYEEEFKRQLDVAQKQEREGYKSEKDECAFGVGYEMRRKQYAKVPKADESKAAKLAKNVGKESDECHKRWMSIRDNFRDALLSNAENNAKATEKNFEVQYSPRSFMGGGEQVFRNPELDVSVETIKPNPSTAAKTKEGSLSPPPLLAKSLGEGQTKLMPFSNQNRKNPNADPLSMFFQSMEKTVRSLGERLQLEVKANIFSIVNEAEKMNLNSFKEANPPPKMFSKRPQPPRPKSSYFTSNTKEETISQDKPDSAGKTVPFFVRQLRESPPNNFNDKNQ